MKKPPRLIVYYLDFLYIFAAQKPQGGTGSGGYHETR